MTAPSLLQWSYTSCLRGQGAGAGFQTYACSEALQPEEKQELERLAAYVPPTDLPSRPTPEEIATLFPVMFRFFRLRSGRYGVLRSVYTGQDYSHRFGNFFAHALVLETGEFPFHPVLFWNTGLFQAGLSEAEAGRQDPPPPLAPLPLPSLAANPALAEARDFLRADPHREELFQQMLRAVLASARQNRRLLLATPQSETIHWTQLLQLALPVRLAHQLSFSLYSFDPAAVPALLSGTSRTGGRLAFSDSQFEREFFIFDTLTGQTSRPLPAGRFEAYAALSFQAGYENLMPLHAFIEAAHPEDLAPLQELSLLYDAVRNGPTPEILAQLESAWKLAQSQTRGLESALAQLIRANPDALEGQLQELGELEVIRRWGGFLLAALAAPAHNELAQRIYTCVQAHLLAQPETARAFNRELNAGQQAAVWLDTGGLAALRTAAERLPGQELAALAALLADLMSLTRRGWSELDSSSAGQLKALSRRMLERLLAEPLLLPPFFKLMMPEPQRFADWLEQLLAFWGEHESASFQPALLDKIVMLQGGPTPEALQSSFSRHRKVMARLIGFWLKSRPRPWPLFKGLTQTLFPETQPLPAEAKLSAGAPELQDWVAVLCARATELDAGELYSLLAWVGAADEHRRLLELINARLQLGKTPLAAGQLQELLGLQHRLGLRLEPERPAMLCFLAAPWQTYAQDPTCCRQLRLQELSQEEYLRFLQLTLRALPARADSRLAELLLELCPEPYRSSYFKFLRQQLGQLETGPALALAGTLLTCLARARQQETRLAADYHQLLSELFQASPRWFKTLEEKLASGDAGHTSAERALIAELRRESEANRGPGLRQQISQTWNQIFRSRRSGPEA